MELIEFEDLAKCNITSEYIVFRFRGLFGDILHGLSRIHNILDKYKDNPKIIIHEYVDRKKALDALCLFDSIPNVKYYIYTKQRCPGFGIGSQILLPLEQLGIPKSQVFDMDVFRGLQAKPNIPYIGIDIPEKKDEKKAVIFRYSGYHGHCKKRNRPFTEWNKIERNLLDKGYTVYLLGKDDTMPITEGVKDLRGQFSIKELLDFTKDASICVCVTTFIYVWQQFVCPTYTLSDPIDVLSLNKLWKLDDKLTVLDVDKCYLDTLDKIISK